MISIHFNSLAKFIIKGMVKKNRVGYKKPIVHTHRLCPKPGSKITRRGSCRESTSRYFKPSGLITRAWGVLFLTFACGR